MACNHQILQRQNMAKNASPAAHTHPVAHTQHHPTSASLTTPMWARGPPLYTLGVSNNSNSRSLGSTRKLQRTTTTTTTTTTSTKGSDKNREIEDLNLIRPIPGKVLEGAFRTPLLMLSSNYELPKSWERKQKRESNFQRYIKHIARHK